MSAIKISKSDVESLIQAGSLGIINRSKSDSLFRELRGNIFTSSWVEKDGENFKIYTGPGCPLIFSNKTGNELFKKFPDLSDEIFTVVKMIGASGTSNLMLIDSGVLIIDKIGNIATTVSNSSSNNSRFVIPGGLNQESFIKDNAMYRAYDQIGVIGIKNNSKNQKLIDINNDLNFEKFPLSNITEYHCNDHNWKWNETDSFNAFAFINAMYNTINIVKVGYFDGLITQSVDASNWDRSGLVVGMGQITENNSDTSLYKTVQHIKKAFNDTKNIRILTDR